MGNLGFQELLLISVVGGIFLIPFVFFLLTLQNTLKAVEPAYRRMEPGKVWLLFIPLFNFYWMFVVIGAIADSLKLQLEQFGVYGEARPTYTLGLAFAVCYACSIIPVIGALPGLASFVLFILYWIKVNEARTQVIALKQTFSNTGENSIFK